MQENESNTWFHSYTQAIVVHSLYNRTPTSRKNELPSHAVLLTISLQTTGGPRDARYHTNGFLFSRIRDTSIVPRSRTSTNWNDALTASKLLWVTRIEWAVGEWHNDYALAFVLEADILSTYCNKDGVMWYVWLFWETITASHAIVCCHSVNHSNIHLIIALTAQSELQISQGSSSTYFRWSGQFRYSFVKGLFRDNPSNFYWNRFIFDRQGAKIMLAQFFWDTVYCGIL